MPWPGTSGHDGTATVRVPALVLVGSVLFAVHRARRNRFDALWGVLWIIGLMAVNVPQFLISEDIPYRTARFLFVPHALCWSCLMLAVMRTERMDFPASASTSV